MADTVFQVQEVHIDRTRNVRVGESGWYEPMDEDKGALFKHWSQEYGRCTGKMYRTKAGVSFHVGYVFQARVPYGADSMKSNRAHWPKPKKLEDTYLCEMWCSWRTLKRDPNAAAPGFAYIPLTEQYEEADL